MVAAQAAAFAAIQTAIETTDESPLDDRRGPVENTTPAPQVRRLAEQVLHDWNMTDRTGDVLLVITELVQNITRHTDDWGELHLRRKDDAILIKVTNTNPQPPRLKSPSPAEPVGHGLLIVAATARRWGNRPAR
jgi:hypothetical protein